MQIDLPLLIIAAFAVRVSKQECCHWKEIDLCGATAVISAHSNPVPSSEEEIDMQCVNIKEAMECFDNYTTRCTTTMHRQIINLLMEGSRDVLNTYCTAGSDLRKWVVQHSSCLLETWEAQKKCTKHMEVSFELFHSAPPNRRRNTFCCAMQQYIHCGTEAAISKCGEEIIIFNNRISGHILSELPNILCSGFEPGSDKCSELLMDTFNDDEDLPYNV